MTDLATRIEQAEGPSRELDAEIATIFGWTPAHDLVCPAYTASLDAAMTLVPDGTNVHAVILDKGLTRIELNGTTKYLKVDAATPALALCAAALRARLNTAQEKL